MIKLDGVTAIVKADCVILRDNDDSSKFVILTRAELAKLAEAVASL